jgi:hypothetical protein
VAQEAKLPCTTTLWVTTTIPSSLPIAKKDDREQAALLGLVLDLYPATLTQDELVRELAGGRPKEFSELDWVQRAIRELVRWGAGTEKRRGRSLGSSARI